MWAITERFRHEAVKMIPSATRHAAQGFFECLHFIYAHAWSCSQIVNLWVHLYVHGYPGFDHIFAECFAHVKALSQCWVTCWSAPMETGHAFILNSLTHAHDQLPVILYVEPSSLSMCWVQKTKQLFLQWWRHCDLIRSAQTRNTSSGGSGCTARGLQKVV